MEYHLAIEKQRAFFLTGATRPIGYRLRQLKILKGAIQKYEAEILEALCTDLGKPAFEGYATEVGMVYEEIGHALRYLKKWARPKRVRAPLTQFPSSCRLYEEPKGIALIMSPWNYPFQLTAAPLVAAIAAGNCVVVKPSRYSEATSAVLEKMLAESFEAEYITIFQGGSAVNTELLREKFDHIFFTGSPAVGHVVMQAAARHLTPVTLELGGKSPCIVDETANIGLAARRIAWGKLINAGQTCVAPDYVAVHSKVKSHFEEAYKKAVLDLYGDAPLEQKDYGKIINRKHFDRLLGLLEQERSVWGGKSNADTLKIEPALLQEATWDSPAMQDEIFGPILPVLTFDSFTGLFEELKQKPVPLAAYLFTKNPQHEEMFRHELRFGGGCINDTVVHLTNPRMPFGGAGQSGMGNYHGYYGFLTFSHQKSILKKSNVVDVPVRYAPYGDRLSTIKKLMR